MTTQLQESAIMPKEGIVLTGLNKTFKTRMSGAPPVHAVRDVDITISPGETVALLGPNGAGKSTTIDMMLGLLAPDKGSVTLFGNSPQRAIAKGAVGAMLQVGGVAQYLSVRELLQMVASLYPSPLPVDEVIKLTRIDDLADRRTNKLSGG
ncbi:MAG TPA: ATP-binding cassette domain-containing protein, partial [Jatrophihabitantaceae bacterium]